ncbi:MAG: hypothetical protein FWF41_05570 [Betaproteobacteria bacterium]|nr:hypothetical protein [Betaproteobacteria bacterium]
MVDDKSSAMVKTTIVLAGTTIYGLTLEEWIGILTLLFLLLQIGILIPRYVEVIEKWLTALKARWRRYRARAEDDDGSAQE